ncbi:hypothetical protein PHMEG_00030829 [Phytophthora megakarya]|uniref:Eukaryotic/viral aspartic protease n=1 Tax=Phytophthora megakarya TaxID=4795 RepID=A0A225V0X1_9STRA|nr:hypothetical protein PHMEG_00030829 [Phytophthora megakarya]
MRILKLKRIADPKEPVTAPATLANRFDAVMKLIRLLKEAGMAPESFDADALFGLDLNVIQATSRDLFQKLKILAGEIPQNPDPLPLTTTSVVDNLTVSSHYASAAEDGSDTSSEPPRRITLWSINAGGEIQDQPLYHRDNGSAPTDEATATESSDRSVGSLQKFFNAAINRYLAEERKANKDPVTTRPQHQGSQDVDMESIRSSDHGSRWDYDPGGVDFPTAAQASVATAAVGSTGSTMIKRVRISATSASRSLLAKTKTKIRRERGSAKSSLRLCEIKHRMMKNLLAGSTKNWYRQLSRSTRNKWSDLLRSFQIQYCGLGVSVARQYYHTRRRSDESPLGYFYRLNVEGLRVRPKIKDGSAKERREHVDHYIEMLEDQDLAERLTLLRLTGADDLEEVLRARGRAKIRQKKAAFESSKYRKNPINTAPPAPAKQVRAIQIQANEFGSDSESDGSGGSGSDIDSDRRISLAANEDFTPKVEKESTNLDPRLPGPSR